jgi:capsular polysaccharide biosynthesis protein
MELREYYKILKNHQSLVLTITAFFIIVGYVITLRSSQIFVASLALNITRAQSQQTTNFRYDQFYRLEADDKFADAIEQWFFLPGFSAEILDTADVKDRSNAIGSLGKTFKAQKTSPEVVEVRWNAASREEADRIKEALVKKLDERVKMLNSQAKDPTWFDVEPTNYFAAPNIQNLPINLTFALIAGLFVGTLAAFVKHYLKDPEDK